MKAIAAMEKGKIAVVEVPLPRIDDYECLVRIMACGLCSSTDLKLYKDGVNALTVRFPSVLGHEAAGVIERVGKKVRNWKAGDRVVSAFGRVDPATGYSINWAQMAQYGYCVDYLAMREDGVCEAPEGYAEYQDYPVKRVPDTIDYPDATILLTLKENYSALKNFGLREGMNLFIFGDGAVALGLASLARVMGAGFVGCAGHHDERLRRLRDVAGADLVVNTREQSAAEAVGERRFDLVIDAVGSVEIALEGAGMLKPGGKVGIYGVLKKGGGNLDLLALPNHIGVHLLNWPYHEHRAHEAVVDMVEKGQVRLKDFYSHVLPCDEAARGFEMIEKREAYKVVFTF